MNSVPPDNGPGYLEIGTNENNEVVINLPCDMTGHIVFSVSQARGLARLLLDHAHKAEDRAKGEVAIWKID